MIRRCLATPLYRVNAQSFLRSRQSGRAVARLQPAASLPRLSEHRRCFASESKGTVDDIIEDIQEQYATTKDEVPYPIANLPAWRTYYLRQEQFEIAVEETEKQSVYAESDRQAAREELDKLKAQYEAAINGPDKETGEEIRQRIGQRIRELDSAVINLEQLAQEQD